MSNRVCEGCGGVIEPGEEAVEAVELIPTPTFGAPNTTAERPGRLFHPDCFPEDDPSYRRVS